MECLKAQNLKHCNCSYDGCPRKGICCQCLRSHFQKGQFPACLFPNDVEKGYDRSIENFLKTYEKRGAWW